MVIKFSTWLEWAYSVRLIGWKAAILCTILRLFKVHYDWGWCIEAEEIWCCEWTWLICDRSSYLYSKQSTQEYFCGSPFFDGFTVPSQSILFEFLGGKINFFFVQFPIKISVFHFSLIVVKNSLLFLHEMNINMKYIISISTIYHQYKHHFSSYALGKGFK